MPIATSKKPSLIEALPCGPYGMVWKKRGYLNLSLMASASMQNTTLPRCMAIGIAGTVRLVPLVTMRSTLSTSSSLV